MSMNELSLFTGAGGGVLGTHLLGWRPVGYVEFNEYCQRIIRQRIDDGYLPRAPIFGDIRTFISEGYARRYRDMADVITAGFPCQPFSVAGKQRGADDPRNMWPATIECIRMVRPKFALLENVPGLLHSGYFGCILKDLAESGYDARWRVLSAAELGAPHKRDRLWIVAHATGLRGRGWGDKSGLQKRCVVQNKQKGSAVRSKAQGCSCHNRKWWTTEPAVGRVAHGVANRVDRLKAIGNRQVPAVAAKAWQLLTQDL